MKRILYFVSVAWLAFSMSGCRLLRWLDEHIVVGGACGIYRPPGVISEFGWGCTIPLSGSSEAGEKLASLALPIAEGLAAPGPDECAFFGLCSGPDDQSDLCDTCRTSAGTSVATPVLLACAGTSYASLPDQLSGVLQADTERGQRTAPFVSTFYKDRSTQRFSECGGETFAYRLDVAGEGQVRGWGESVVRGPPEIHVANAVRLLAVAGVTGGAGVELFTLRDSSCVNSSGRTRECGVFLGGFAFNGFSFADGVATQAMIPQTGAGAGGSIVYQAPVAFRRARDPL